ncbi:hypothetical protein E4U55_005598 [Claviceps digitariae]|nr:hypothetical protein E4U55_005598 [Claviceps digitariae]
MAGGPAILALSSATRLDREIFEAAQDGAVVTPVTVNPSPSPQRIAILPSVQLPSHTSNMAAPRRIHGEKPRRAPKGYVASAYDTLTSPDNATFVRSIALFGAAVTFLASPWGELLLPPQPIANLAHSPKHGTAKISVQKRRSDTGRRLSHLVSKFEILDSLSRQSKPLPIKKVNLPGGNDSTLQLNRPPSSNSSVVSARSLYHHATSDKLGNPGPAREEALKDDEPATGEGRVSLVAERRRLFEVNLGEARLRTLEESQETLTTAGLTDARNVDAHPTSSRRPLTQVPLLSSTWQTLRARSPSPCMAQSQTAVLSRPTIANVSKRLAGYLPLSSTCPSLPNVQIGAQPHTLSDCVQSCMQDGQQLVEDWTSMVTPGPCTPSPTTDKGKQAQTPDSTSEYELAPDEDQETPRAGAGGDDFPANIRRRVTPTGGENVHHHHGAATARIPNATRSTQVGSMSMYRNSCGTNMDDGRFDQRDATKMSFPGARESDSSCMTAARAPNGKHPEAAAAHVFEASPRKSLNPPRISNTIEHFEALISGDGPDGKFKSSIRLPKRLTGSSSCHLSKPEGRPKMGAAESARRKFSNSWGPARFRKSRVPCGGDARQSERSDEHSSYKRPNDQMPADGTTKESPPAPEHWLARFHSNNKKTNTSHVAQVQTSKTRSMTSGRLRPKGPRPQPTTTTAANERISRSVEQLSTKTEMHANDGHGHGHGSWRSRRRWVSRSSAPLVAQADCALQQPKPIRVNEVRRLVSLCRDKVTARKYRAQTD